MKSAIYVSLSLLGFAFSQCAKSKRLRGFIINFGPIDEPAARNLLEERELISRGGTRALRLKTSPPALKPIPPLRLGRHRGRLAKNKLDIENNDIKIDPKVALE